MAGDPFKQTVRLTLRPLSLNCVCLTWGKKGRTEDRAREFACSTFCKEQPSPPLRTASMFQPQSLRSASSYRRRKKVPNERATNEFCSSRSGSHGLVANLIGRSPPIRPAPPPPSAAPQFNPLRAEKHQLHRGTKCFVSHTPTGAARRSLLHFLTRPGRLNSRRPVCCCGSK